MTDGTGVSQSIVFNVVISLQVFDIDPNSLNVHVLFDRIGIFAYVGKYSGSRAFNEMIITDIELPLDEKGGDLISLIRELDDLCKNVSKAYMGHLHNTS